MLAAIGHAVCVIDVKGTMGGIEVAGRTWYAANRGSFYSMVAGRARRRQFFHAGSVTRARSRSMVSTGVARVRGPASEMPLAVCAAIRRPSG